MVSPALFVFAHPDDELLAAGVSLAEHVDASADVHVLWLTRGEASSALGLLAGTTTSTWWAVPHTPAVEGYTAPTPAELGQARIAEATTAVRCLATPGTVALHQAGLPDGAVTQASARAAILEVADQIAPGAPVRLKVHSWLVDDHPDHLAAGAAVRQLGQLDPDRFGDIRYYVESPYWQDARLSQVAEFWDLPASGSVSARVVNATRAYGAWAPEAGRYAVGYHSVPGLLDALAAQPRSMVHP